MITGDILSNKEMRLEILEYIDSGKILLPTGDDISEGVINSIVVNNIESESFMKNSVRHQIESIIELHGRPPLLVKNNTFEVPVSDIWKNSLRKNKSFIDAALPSVGRIELRDHPLYVDKHYGTGWLIDNDIIVTNRHVANYFINHTKDGAWQFRKTPTYDTVKARIDFLEEHESYDENEFKIIEILDVSPDIEDGYPDVAFFRIDVSSNSNIGNPIKLSNNIITKDSTIVTIGYPANDRSTIRSEGGELGVSALDRYFNNIYDVKRVQPGYVLSSTEKLLTYDSTTLNKNSGSVVLDITTGEAVGMHFAGKYGVHNIAIPSPILANRLANI